MLTKSNEEEEPQTKRKHVNSIKRRRNTQTAHKHFKQHQTIMKKRKKHIFKQKQENKKRKQYKTILTVSKEEAETQTTHKRV